MEFAGREKVLEVIVAFILCSEGCLRSFIAFVGVGNAERPRRPPWVASKSSQSALKTSYTSSICFLQMHLKIFNI